ncbi:hypothetical protein SLS62_001776 [Diatrype stigma]|uniref:Uncharacterized protein n=1 Tax=Diatrype stigma TaxID=117547 RepID=A0AAN9YRE9_9PEZI
MELSIAIYMELMEVTAYEFFTSILDLPTTWHDYIPVHLRAQVEARNVVGGSDSRVHAGTPALQRALFFQPIAATSSAELVRDRKRNPLLQEASRPFFKDNVKRPSGTNDVGGLTVHARSRPFAFMDSGNDTVVRTRRATGLMWMMMAAAAIAAVVFRVASYGEEWQVRGVTEKSTSREDCLPEWEGRVVDLKFVSRECWFG